MWPVDGVVGENGALYFWYDPQERKGKRRFIDPDSSASCLSNLLPRMGSHGGEQLFWSRSQVDLQIGIDYSHGRFILKT